MSTYLVSESTISAVVNLADALYPRGCTLAGVSIPDVKHERDRMDALNAAGAALWRLNNDAVNARYSQTEPAPAGFVYRPALVQGPGDIKRLLREAYTLHYQLQQGDVPARPEYAEFERLLIRAGRALAEH